MYLPTHIWRLRRNAYRAYASSRTVLVRDGLSPIPKNRNPSHRSLELGDYLDQGVLGTSILLPST
jgi:hypothetical protein